MGEQDDGWPSFDVASLETVDLPSYEIERQYYVMCGTALQRYEALQRYTHTLDWHSLRCTGKKKKSIDNMLTILQVFLKIAASRQCTRAVTETVFGLANDLYHAESFLKKVWEVAVYKLVQS
jgi:hypothetical protein